jgi:hypothetical protein
MKFYFFLFQNSIHNLFQFNKNSNQTPNIIPYHQKKSAINLKNKNKIKTHTSKKKEQYKTDINGIYDC